jgi:PHD/YefM family antitoxin component YafN of YafNO toxin-antitoxin module
MTPSLVALSREHVASIRDVQKNPSRALCGITRVVRGSKTIGFFLSNEEWEQLMEDIEASQSPTLKKSIAKARRELAAKKTVSLEVVAKQYGISY